MSARVSLMKMKMMVVVMLMMMFSYYFVETWSHCVALAGLECYIDVAGLELIEIYLPLPVKCLD